MHLDLRTILEPLATMSVAANGRNKLARSKRDLLLPLESDLKALVSHHYSAHLMLNEIIIVCQKVLIAFHPQNVRVHSNDTAFFLESCAKKLMLLRLSVMFLSSDSFFLKPPTPR